MKHSFRNPTGSLSRRTESVFRFFQMLSIALTVWTVGRMLLPYDEWMLLLIFPLTAVAFYLQTGLCRLYPKKERDRIPFSQTLPLIALWTLLSVAAYGPIYGWLERGLLPDLHYSSDFATWTVFTVCFLFLMLLTVSLVAVIPPSAFFSYGSAYTMGIVYLILWILTLFGERSVNGRLMLSAGLITVFYFVAMNQMGIDDLSKKSRVMGVTPELRGKNLRLTGFSLLGLVGLFVLFVILLTGIYFTAKSLLFFFLRATLNEDSTAARDVQAQLSTLFSGGLFESPSVNKILYAIFAVAMVILFLFACIRMITHGQLRLRDIPAKLFFLWKKLLKKLRELFEWRRPGRYMPKQTAPQPYQDKVTRMNPSSYRMSVRNLDSFNRRLREIPEADERFCYAYGVLIGQWRRMDPAKSTVPLIGMTPREIEKKLVSDGQSGFIEITRLYETIRYAEKPVSDEDAERLTGRMCVYIEDNFNKMTKGNKL